MRQPKPHYPPQYPWDGDSGLEHAFLLVIRHIRPPLASQAFGFAMSFYRDLVFKGAARGLKTFSTIRDGNKAISLC